MGIFNKLGVLVANVAIARMYLCNAKQLQMIFEYDHPEGRMKISELVSDSLGKYQKAFSFVEGSYEPNKSPKDVEDERFANNLCDVLEKVQDQFNQIIIFAPGHFQSQIKRIISNTLEAKIYTFVDKDYTKISEVELMHHIFDTVRP